MMRQAMSLLAIALLCLAMTPVFAQTTTATPDAPVMMPESTAEMTPESTAEMTPEMGILNPLALVGAESVAFIRFAHTVADVAPIDFYVQEMGDTPVVENLAFGEEAGFLYVPSGSYNIIARAAGSGIEGEIITTMNHNFQQNTSWLVVFVGLTSTLSLQIEPINLLRDDIDDDVSRVRLVNFVSGGPALTITSATEDNFGQGLGWISVFDADFTPGPYTLTVTTPDGAALLTDAVVELESDALTTLLLVGSADGTQALRFITFKSPEYVSRVQFVNNSSDAIQIFVRPGDQEIVASLGVGETSDWVTVSSGAVTFVTYVPGTGPTGQELGAWIGEVHPLRDLTITFMPDNSADESDAVFSP